MPLSIHNLTRKLTPRPDPRAVEDQDPRHDGEERPDAAEQAARGAEAKVIVH